MNPFSMPFSFDVTGRISSQLSIISATIQSITNTWNESQLTNQLIEIDVSNLDKTSTEPVCYFPPPPPTDTLRIPK